MKQDKKDLDIKKPTGEINNKSTYVCGLDLARQGKDETAIAILEQLPFDKNIFLIYIDVINTPDLTVVLEKIRALDSRYHFKKIITDETGIGAGLTDFLKQKLGHRVEGVWYTQKIKAELFNNLKVLMSRKEGKLYIPDYTVNPNPLVKKMFYQFLSITVEYKEGSMVPKISHEEREHDDIVNAIALASSYFQIGKRRRKYPLVGLNG